MQNITKGNYWTILIFKDNWEKNPNWKEKLIDTHLRFCVSPLHNKDTWNELDITKHPEREEYIRQHLGEHKTEHYHVLIHCDDNTTFKTMKEITESLDLPIPFVCRAPEGMYHYFSHEFNPDKAQYDPNEIKHYNGSDPSDYLMEITKKVKMDMLKILTLEFRRLKCQRYSDMCDIAAKMPNPNFLQLTQTNYGYFHQILVDNIMDRKDEMTKVR